MDLDSINASRLLMKYMPLIHKTMNRLNISKKHMLYDDFIQEFQIKLIQLYRSFDGDPINNEADSFKFTAYAGRGLYWRGIDLIRNKSLTSCEPVDDEKLEMLTQEKNITSNVLESNYIIQDFYRKAKEKLSTEDYLLFLYLSDSDYTIQQIAETFGVSRGTIYKRKKKIQSKLEDLKEYLMN
ncbi:hypothetical protein GCM10008932_05710 [Alkalibacterium iburiense]|uniref:Resolvase HTH domain-containing protein n=1 Tax=Alkalibacterium iburiense TaxID=290589 RepID=A0ABN0X5A4_9LACT